VNHTLQKVADIATIGVGGTAPIWVAISQTWLGWLAALCAALIGLIRLGIAIRDWRNGKRDR